MKYWLRRPLVERGPKDTMTWSYLSSCSIPLWIDIAGKFCSTSNWARALQRCTDFTKMITCQSKLVLLTTTLERWIPWADGSLQKGEAYQGNLI